MPSWFKGATSLLKQTAVAVIPPYTEVLMVDVGSKPFDTPSDDILSHLGFYPNEGGRHSYVKKWKRYKTKELHAVELEKLGRVLQRYNNRTPRNLKVILCLFDVNQTSDSDLKKNVVIALRNMQSCHDESYEALLVGYGDFANDLAVSRAGCEELAGIFDGKFLPLTFVRENFEAWGQPAYEWRSDEDDITAILDEFQKHAT